MTKIRLKRALLSIVINSKVAGIAKKIQDKKIKDINSFMFEEIYNF